ncbi:hypothetical protein ACLKA7_017215 [Drosophila subpalustris]
MAKKQQPAKTAAGQTIPGQAKRQLPPPTLSSDQLQTHQKWNTVPQSLWQSQLQPQLQPLYSACGLALPPVAELLPSSVPMSMSTSMLN